MPLAGSAPPCPKANMRSPNGAQERRMALLPGGGYFVNLTAARSLNIQLTQQTDANGVVTVHAILSGAGTHSIAMRAANLVRDRPEQSITLPSGVPQTVTWRARIVERDAPWTAVVIPDKDLAQREELTGAGGNAR
jgi:hypothetical protein